MWTGPVIDSYAWVGGREPMLRFGPMDGPVVVLALPLFEEANRTRAFGVTLLRALAARGIGGALPELPSQGESERTTSTLKLDELRDAYNAAVSKLGRNHLPYGVSIRSGALIEADADYLFGRWRLTPQTGEALVRELARVQRLTRKRADPALTDPWGPEDWPAQPIEVAGNLIDPACIAWLQVAKPFVPTGVPVRVVQLGKVSSSADLLVAGTAPWRRAEPGSDPALAELLADDIAAWIATCEG